jgi:hypothetical protein
MPEQTDLPPVLETLGEDLYAAMKAADAALPIDSRRGELDRPATAGRQRARLIRAIASTSRVSKRWAAVGVAAVAAAVAALVLGTTGGGPPNALAGWTASPTTPAGGQLHAAELACGHSAPALASRPPTVADTRGPFAMLVYVENGAASICMTGLPGASPIVTEVGPAPTPVAPDAIEPRAGSATIRRQGPRPRFNILTGQAGANVTRVTLALDDGSSIETTIARGWFAAWWPGSQGVQSAAITTASGTTTQQLSTPALPASRLQGLAGLVAGKHWRGLSPNERGQLVHLLRADSRARRLSGGERTELRRLLGKLDPSATGRSGASSRGASRANRKTPTK